LAKCLTRLAIRFSHRLSWLKLARCLCHLFTSPSSTSRRIASERIGLSEGACPVIDLCPNAGGSLTAVTG
jgi:hypothetical protein